MNVNLQNQPFQQFDITQVSKVSGQKCTCLSDGIKLSDSQYADSFKKTAKGNLKVNPLRIWFNRLTKEQIKAINETRQLPKNIKIRPNDVGTGFHIYHNIFNLKSGTTSLPEGFELRQNRLGFTRLLPKDTEGFWIRKK